MGGVAGRAAQDKAALCAYQEGFYRPFQAETQGRAELSGVLPLNAIIKWLQSQDVLVYSQFTIDWVEDITDRYQEMEEQNELPDEDIANGAIKYQAENILEVLNPRLPDVEFFKQILKQVS